ncbi:Diguanylate cyclase DosC [Novipirellula artificiosorum]|uniref:diguanylate cyclase n=2 Tax=Novipirellula artificiosorum TaxID=2528016 RepID=A0A5C6CVQ6_9BACT|nr:Diguanylate cyclase DosC [Novipirellula artificiosorum]
MTPFAIAKQALGFVAQFRTPPTPDVYEVWYRYAEGSNTPLCEQLSYAVNDAESADAELLEQLHQQFFTSGDQAELNQQLGEGLSKTIGSVESIIHDQQSAGNAFQSSVRSASASLDEDAATVDDLKACVASVLQSNHRMQEQLSQMASRLEESHRQVTTLRDRYFESQKKLMTDPLTGVGNRLFFDTIIASALEHQERGKRHFFLLLVDLDKFKLVNDTFGHAAGDQVLRFVATNIERLAGDASVARYGGDEFAIFLNSIDMDEGVHLAETVCQFFAKNKMTLNDTHEYLGQLTSSIGGALLRANDNHETWFERADKLLYSAKNGGRNRVMVERKLD